MNQTKYSLAVEDVQEYIEYKAQVIHDDEVIAEITATSPESLLEQFKKLETAEASFVEQKARERIEEGYYDS